MLSYQSQFAYRFISSSGRYRANVGGAKRYCFFSLGHPWLPRFPQQKLCDARKSVQFGRIPYLHVGQMASWYAWRRKSPMQRGFEKYYGILAGATSYLKPQGGRGLWYNNTKLSAPPQGNYYTTDAFTDSAISFVSQQKDNKPFFLYLAFNAPHWPLQAKESNIKKFEGAYAKGWDKIREERYARQLKLGIADTSVKLSQRDTAVRPWTDLNETEKKEVAYRMEVYAAQVSSIDDNVGKLISYLQKKNQLDNTLIIFLSNNGACPEPIQRIRWRQVGRY